MMLRSVVAITRSLAPVSVVDLQHLLPGRAAVGRLVDAALAAGPEERAGRRDEHDVVVDRIDDDAVDVPRLAQPHVAPRLAAVGRLVDAVAPRRALAVVRFAGADPDEVGILLRHRRRRRSTSAPCPGTALRTSRRCWSSSRRRRARCRRSRSPDSPRTPPGPRCGRTSSPGRSTGNAGLRTPSATGVAGWPDRLTETTGSARATRTAHSETKRRCLNMDPPKNGRVIISTSGSSETADREIRSDAGMIHRMSSLSCPPAQSRGPKSTTRTSGTSTTFTRTGTPGKPARAELERRIGEYAALKGTLAPGPGPAAGGVPAERRARPARLQGLLLSVAPVRRRPARQPGQRAPAAGPGAARALAAGDVLVQPGAARRSRSRPSASGWPPTPNSPSTGSPSKRCTGCRNTCSTSTASGCCRSRRGCRARRTKRTRRCRRPTRSFRRSRSAPASR